MTQYKDATRLFLADFTATLRKSRSLTQEKMAEDLHISSRAYGDLERGKYCFSALTLMFLLLLLSDPDARQLLDQFRELIRTLDEKEAF